MLRNTPYINTNAFLSVCCFLSALTATAQFQGFERTYNPDPQGGEEGHSIVETPDGGYFTVGFSGVAIGHFNLLAVRLDANGDTLWTRTSWTGGFDMYNEVILDHDSSGYIAVGDGTYMPAFYTNGIVTKFDDAGNSVWQRLVGDTVSTSFHSVALTYDGGYLLAGTRLHQGGGSANIFLMKMDNTAQIVWQRELIGSYADVATRVRQLSDSSIVVTGYTGSPQFAQSAVSGFVWKLDSSGAPIWFRTYGDSLPLWNCRIHDVVELPNGNLILGGILSSVYAFDHYLLIVNPNGDRLAEKTYGNGFDDELGYQLIYHENSPNFYFVGKSPVLNIHNHIIDHAASVTCYSLDLDSLWETYYGNYYNEDFKGGCTTRDGGIAMTGGYFNSPDNPGQVSLYVVKVDSNGCLLPGCGQNSIPVVETPTSLGLYPNPTNGPLHISLGTEHSEGFTVEVWSSLGQQVYKQEYPQGAGIGDGADIDIRFLAAGLYWVRVIGGGGQGVMVQH